MIENAQRKSPFLLAVWHFVIRCWRGIVAGFLVGAAVGFAAPTLLQVGGGLGGIALRWTNRHLGGVAVWPKGGTVTLFVILSVFLLLCVMRIAVFLRRAWVSWRAGLISGIAVVWFLASAVTFTLLSLTGSLLAVLALAVGVAGTLFVFQRDARIGESSEAVSQADPDEPISRKEEDILERDAVVASVVRAVVDDRAPVVALTGRFGDGKTSVLNLLASALDTRKDVVCVRFSTWLPMDEKTLVSTLLGTVLTNLETRLFIPTVKRDLVAFTRLLSSVLPNIPASLTEWVHEPSQDQRIAEMQRNLSRLPIRVVVLLDDMDRMRRNELEVLLKLLRGVPEFPQFTYVCAFDRRSLVQTLQRDVSEKSREEAEHFLEKFFPDEIPLPKIEDARLAVEFEKRFYATCDVSNLITEPAERQKFKDEFRPLWAIYLKSYFSNLRT